MVALKIQSLDDIIVAYGKSLGFDNENLSNLTHIIQTQYADKINENDVIGSLDDILYALVKPYLPPHKRDKPQALAMFKMLFLLNNGADICGIELFEKGVLSAQMQQILSDNRLQIVPPLKMSKMEPQKIEPINWLAPLTKLVHLFRKG